MDSKIKLIADSFGLDKVKLDEPISDHVATHLGGLAKLFFVAIHQSEIIRMMEMIRSLKVPFLIFGSGSKMLISDNGFDGVVLKNRTSRMIVVGVKGRVGRAGIGVSEAIVEVDSGVTIAKLLEFLQKQNFNQNQISFVTGTVGGNLLQSRQMQSLVQKIKVLDSDGELLEIDPKLLNLSRHIILSVVFKFRT